MQNVKEPMTIGGLKITVDTSGIDKALAKAKRLKAVLIEVKALQAEIAAKG